MSTVLMGEAVTGSNGDDARRAVIYEKTESGVLDFGCGME